jgi:predicted AlkP superfamily pyrophosphatase or phosphodiesterase
MKQLILLFVLAFTLINCKTQEHSIASNSTIEKSNKPKLVIGIIVDQMRSDYLSRFYTKYSEGGFKRLMKDGYNLKNAHFNYSSTKTGVGHASIFTGTTPENHGVLSNDWYDKQSKKMINCVGDNRYKTVGTSSNEGQKSPYRIQTTTIADQLHLAQNMNGKTIGISIKDRGAILPVGHTANAAYWFEGNDEGKWITSTYYTDKLPNWVTRFNNSNRVENYLSKPWNTYYDISTYNESTNDNNNYEQVFKGKKTPTFPYELPKLRAENNNYSLIKDIPFGNSLITDFAIEAIKNEKMGQSQFVDFLSVSFSSTDHIGHGFGVSSKETQDAYIRLDKDIERLLIFLDNEVGKDNYTLFLTADHGAAEVPQYLIDNSIPAGYVNKQELRNHIKNIAKALFNSDKIIEHISNNNIYFDKQEIKELGLNLGEAEQLMADELIEHKDIYKTVTARTLQTTDFIEGPLSLIQNSYNQKLSGDILFIYKPSTITNWYENKGGTTHGSGYNYDTHAPLIFYGNGIKKGLSHQYHPIIDIAPTLSALLGIEFPNGSTGKVIEKVLK